MKGRIFVVIGKIGFKLTNLFSKKLGTSKNGIEVYKKITINGMETISSYKDRQLYKTITKQVSKKNYLEQKIPNTEVTHTTIVKNNNTGVTTKIQKTSVDYKKNFSKFHTNFNSKKCEEFSVYRFDQDNMHVGMSSIYLSSPGYFTSTRVTRYKNGLPYYDAVKNVDLKKGLTDRYIDVVNYEFPNGSKVTGNFARRTYKDPITNTIKTHDLYCYNDREIAVIQNDQCENIVKTGYNVIN